ncbi:hypothetical protein ES319_D11G261300v1 [Gossypium barbadense]|uniref:Uncharacterized protein n=1 Tax=Gossypium barbadense TaxID=3634 RepID=A0A5J5PFU2_GOSBA|nr:hypothetical protein ES319_D11G261300v1 [Gossypium barbadense]
MPSLLAKPCAASFAFRVKASPATNILLKPNSSAKNTVCKHAHTSAMVEFNTCSFRICHVNEHS